MARRQPKAVMRRKRTLKSKSEHRLRLLAFEPLEARLLLTTSDSGGNRPPDLDLRNVASQIVVVDQRISVNLFAIGASVRDIDSSGQETGDRIRLYLDPDVPKDTPLRASLTTEGVFSWTPTLDQVGRYEIVVIAVDAGSPARADSETFVITVVPNNRAPVSISLSATTISENATAAVVGQLTVVDPDDSSTPFGQHTFLVQENTGSGFVSSTRFEVNSTGSLKLQTGKSLDHETEPTVTVRVIATDGGTPGLSVNQDFAITVSDVNDTIDLVLPDPFDNGELLPFELGNLIAFTALVTNPSGVAFNFGVKVQINGADVTPNPAPTISSSGQFSWTPAATGQFTVVILATPIDGSRPDDERFEVSITTSAQNHPPTSISLSASTVSENATAAVVGQLAVVDPDDSSTPFGRHTFQVQENTGSGFVTSTRFEVNTTGSLKLQTGKSLDHEAEPTVATIEQINRGEAIIRWTPLASDLPGPMRFRVLVIDSGLPPLVDTEDFFVILTPAT